MADGDQLIAFDPAIKIASPAPAGELRRYPFSHFGMYFGDGFERAAADQAEFLRRHLCRRPRARVEAPLRALEALPSTRS